MSDDKYTLGYGPTEPLTDDPAKAHARMDAVVDAIIARASHLLCPACGHAKHVGWVCGVEPDELNLEPGSITYINCPCHEEARKASAGKCKGFHLLPWDALEEVARVYEFGATKYEADSWREANEAIMEYTNAMFRHWKSVSREGLQSLDKDAEARGFKIRHLAQVAWNILALVALSQEDAARASTDKEDRNG